jgi:hypothetical protein
MRNGGDKIAKPSFLHKPDFAGVHCLFTGFSRFFIAFQSFFHGVTIFANLKGAPSIFQAWDIFGGGIFLGIVSQKYDFKNNHIEETSVVKA